MNTSLETELKCKMGLGRITMALEHQAGPKSQFAVTFFPKKEIKKKKKFNIFYEQNQRRNSGLKIRPIKVTWHDLKQSNYVQQNSKTITLYNALLSGLTILEDVLLMEDCGNTNLEINTNLDHYYRSHKSYSNSSKST